MLLGRRDDRVDRVGEYLAGRIRRECRARPKDRNGRPRGSRRRAIAAIASAFSTPSAVSIWQNSVVRSLAAANLSATAPGAVAVMRHLQRDAALAVRRVFHRIDDVPRLGRACRPSAA